VVLDELLEEVVLDELLTVVVVDELLAVVDELVVVVVDELLVVEDAHKTLLHEPAVVALQPTCASTQLHETPELPP
jgi:hypothetical protein